jgi:hypothetical protein
MSEAFKEMFGREVQIKAEYRYAALDPNWQPGTDEFEFKANDMSLEELLDDEAKYSGWYTRSFGS